MNLRNSLTLLAAVLIPGWAGAAPSITGFSPAFASSGDINPVQISGSGFLGSPLVVKFNNVQDTTAQATSDAYIEAHVPAGAPLGPGKIYVSVAGVATVSATNFTVIGPGPYIAGFSPPGGSDGTAVVISGTHFTAGAGSTTVKFNGKTASINMLGDNSITAFAPSGVTTGPITVARTGYLTATSSVPFYVNPVITGFSPFNGRTGTNVVIRGTNFNDAASVVFNDVNASTFTVNSPNQITALVPTNATTGPIYVYTPAANPGFTTSNFVVQPTIFSFTPNFGRPGTNVTVTGANFLASGLKVKFGGIQATQPSHVSFGQLTAVVPAGATNGPLTLITVDGSNTTADLFYLPATISSFTPSNSPPGTAIKITGLNFLGATAVTFNGAPADGFTVTNNTTLGAVVPSGVITGPIGVTTPAGSTNTGTALFYGAPVISSFTPTQGPPGTAVTILGTNFLGTTGVKFNGLAASTVTVVNNGRIDTVVPNNAQPGPISVVGVAGTATSSQDFAVTYSSDLGVILTAAPNPVFVGSNLVYTITVANAGPYAAPNARLTNDLPPSVTFKSATTSQGTLNTSGNPILGSLGTINVGSHVTVSVRVVPQAAGVIVDSASVGSDNLDPAGGNNVASAQTTVWPLPTLSIAALTNQFQLSWPAALSNFTLQYTTNLAAPIFWSSITSAPVISGGQSLVLRTNNGTNTFFRLKY